MTSIPAHLTTAASRALAALLRGDHLDSVVAVEELTVRERELLARAARTLADLAA
jgi:hypothetical protein